MNGKLCGQLQLEWYCFLGCDACLRACMRFIGGPGPGPTPVYPLLSKLLLANCICHDECVTQIRV